jgi:hypothetical protein
LFHADRWNEGQADTTVLIVAFHNFANASKRLFANAIYSAVVMRTRVMTSGFENVTHVYALVWRPRDLKGNLNVQVDSDVV